jgi:hypothetical protein
LEKVELSDNPMFDIKQLDNSYDPQEQLLIALGVHPDQQDAQQKVTDALGSGTPKPDTAAATPAYPPTPTSMATDNGVAPIARPNAARPVITPDQRQAAHQAELDRLTSSTDHSGNVPAGGASGISQIQNPFLRTIARIGDVAGRAMFPSIEREIPGTEGHHRDLVNTAQGQVNTDLGQQAKTAQTAQEVATTAHTKAETDALENPQPKPKEETWEELKDFTGPNGEPLQMEKNSGQVKIAGGNILGIKRVSANQKEGEMPLTDRVSQLNSMLATRFQVLNPGKPLPTQYTLPQNATQKDYDRIDKGLEAEERAVGTKAQQDTANEMRRQTAALAAQNAEDRRDKDSMQVVVGTDADGNRVLVSKGEADKLNLTGVTKADADLQNKSEAARHWLTLASKNGDTPETMGIMQLIDKMDKEGKLGIAASRWSDFMAGKVGAGDREFTALRAKMGLANTKLMQAHVGSRGGAFMLEHFEDLANAGKMDAQTLKAGVGSELDYMKDVAMLPQSKKEAPAHAPAPGRFDWNAHPKVQ